MADPVGNFQVPIDTSGGVKSVLAHVGTVRTEILVFSILASILLNIFAAISTYQHPDPIAGVMKIAGIAILFLGFAFYIYAFLRLPGSSQEKIFTEQAVAEIAKTNRVVRAARGAGT